VKFPPYGRDTLTYTCTHPFTRSCTRTRASTIYCCLNFHSATQLVFTFYCKSLKSLPPLQSKLLPSQKLKQAEAYLTTPSHNTTASRKSPHAPSQTPYCFEKTGRMLRVKCTTSLQNYRKHCLTFTDP
jgi:hypothetical protein